MSNKAHVCVLGNYSPNSNVFDIFKSKIALNFFLSDSFFGLVHNSGNHPPLWRDVDTSKVTEHSLGQNWDIFMEATMNLLLKEGGTEFCNSVHILVKCTSSQYLNMGDNLLELSSCLFNVEIGTIMHDF